MSPLASAELLHVPGLLYSTGTVPSDTGKRNASLFKGDSDLFQQKQRASVALQGYLPWMLSDVTASELKVIHLAQEGDAIGPFTDALFDAGSAELLKKAVYAAQVLEKALVGLGDGSSPAAPSHSQKRRRVESTTSQSSRAASHPLEIAIGKASDGGGLPTPAAVAMAVMTWCGDECRKGHGGSKALGNTRPAVLFALTKLVYGALVAAPSASSLSVAVEGLRRRSAGALTRHRSEPWQQFIAAPRKLYKPQLVWTELDPCEGFVCLDVLVDLLNRWSDSLDTEFHQRWLSLLCGRVAYCLSACQEEQEHSAVFTRLCLRPAVRLMACAHPLATARFLEQWRALSPHPPAVATLDRSGSSALSGVRLQKAARMLSYRVQCHWHDKLGEEGPGFPTLEDVAQSRSRKAALFLQRQLTLSRLNLTELWVLFVVTDIADRLFRISHTALQGSSSVAGPRAACGEGMAEEISELLQSLGVAPATESVELSADSQSLQEHWRALFAFLQSSSL